MHRDFKELLSAFNAGKVRYLIVGGYAVSYHTQARATKDLDILIGADAENSKGGAAVRHAENLQKRAFSAEVLAQLDSGI
jgi:hypothetical protein